MATLDKIKICGIRSFGCEEEDVQTVCFQKPLTLILGENGCGKSTIIECLRYLTAQREPSGKGTFMHDPSLASRATVKGFIKLRMHDVTGCAVDLCRQMQATKSKKTVSTKTLDNVITRTDKVTKEKVSLSNRCADFTLEISRLFGVSRAILENVIFCSQEDSLWPLDTDLKLKEKFDQIFDSDKFNKCINKVRDKRKKIRDVVKNCEIEIKYLKNNKSLAAEKNRLIEKTKKQVDQFNKEIQALNLSLEEIENEIKTVNEKEMHTSQNHALKEMKKAELKNIEDYLVELKSRIHNYFEGSDEELKQELLHFNKFSMERQKEIIEEEEKIKEFCDREGKLSKALMREQGVLGQLLKEEEMNKERESERSAELTKLASDLKISVPSQLQSKESVRDFLKKVKAQVMEEEDELAKKKLMLEEEEQDLQANIDQLREKSILAQSEVANEEKSLKNCQSEINRVQKEMKEMDQSASKLSTLESALFNVDKELKDLSDSVNPEELKMEVKISTEERNQLEERLSETEENVKVLQQKSSLSTELNVQKDLKSNKDSQFRRLINKHEESLRGLLGDLPESRFKAAIQNHIDSARQKVKELTALRSKKEKDLIELEMKRKHMKEKLRTTEETLRSIEEEIYDACGSTDFEESVALTKRQLEDLQDLKGTLSSSEVMFQRYIKGLQKAQPCCPLCHRDFEQQSEAQALVEELTAKIREVPNRLLENKNQLEEKQRKYNKLIALRSKFDQIEVLKNKEIPDLRSDLEKTEVSLKTVQKELNDLEREIHSPQEDEATCISLQDDMVLLDQINSERGQLQKQIEKLQSSLGGGAVDKNSLQSALNEQDGIRQKLKLVRQRLEESQSKLSVYNEQIQLKQSTKNSLMEQVNKIHGSVGQKSKFMEKLSELRSEEKERSAELKSLKENLETVKQKLQDAISKKNLEKSRNAEKIERMTHTVKGFLKQLHVIEEHDKVIEAYERKGVEERIDAVQAVMAEIEDELKSIKKGKEAAVKKVDEIKKKLSNQELRERELEDNCKLRQKTVEAKNLKSEVAVLEEKFGNADFDGILREKRKLKAKEEEIRRNKAEIQGRLGEMENQIRMLEDELKNKVFKTVYEDYNKESLKAEVLKAIGTDLERYATTMEYAMMKYHKEQMNKVNEFIREYWRKIYQGNDIDYIEIQTNNIESTERRRNYNYKVVQVKSNVCLDMRNRCSAGQKMLASLIIRLALAETFGGNCGILTLDEPTTNLDRRNIKNLARTLSEVLLTKQSLTNTNFQLIVITHDEEFLQELMQLDIVNEYVKVERSLMGKTKISNRTLSSSESRNLTHANRFHQRHQYEYD